MEQHSQFSPLLRFDYRMQPDGRMQPLSPPDFPLQQQQQFQLPTPPQKLQQTPVEEKPTATPSEEALPKEKEKLPEQRYAILPGGMFARTEDVYVESLPNGKGRRPTGTLAMSLKDLLNRYDSLELHYSRLKEENIKFRQILFELYKSLPTVHPANFAAGDKLRSSLGLPPASAAICEVEPQDLLTEPPEDNSNSSSGRGASLHVRPGNNLSRSSSRSSNSSKNNRSSSKNANSLLRRGLLRR